MNEYYLQAFEQLGTPPTTDKRRIKKAYAALVKQYHPEEFPEQWEVIHRAYEIAMEYAKQKGGSDHSRELAYQDPSIYQSPPIDQAHPVYQAQEPQISDADREPLNRDIQDPHDLSSQLFSSSIHHQEKALGVDFDALLVSHTQQEQEVMKMVFIYLEQIKRRKNGAAWNAFFESTAFFYASKEIQIVNQFCDALEASHLPPKMLRNIMATIHQLRERVMNVAEIQQVVSPQQLLAFLDQLAHSACGSLGDYERQKKKRKFKTRGWVFVAALVLIVMVVGVSIELASIFNNIYDDTSNYTSDDISSSIDLESIEEDGYNSNLIHMMEDERVTSGQEYLDRKYGEGVYQISNSDVSWELLKSTIHLPGEGAPMAWGYSGADEGTIYYDNAQTPDILKALQEEVVLKTGLQELMILPGTQVMESPLEKEERKPAFHEKYSGDLKDFFDREAVYRSETPEEIPYHGSDNGIFAIYIKDPTTTSLQERPGNPSAGVLAQYNEQLAALEGMYHIQIYALLAPGDYYDQLSKELMGESTFYIPQGSSVSSIPRLSGIFNGLYSSGSTLDIQWQPLADGIWYISNSEEQVPVIETTAEENKCMVTLQLSIPWTERSSLYHTVILDQEMLGCAGKEIMITTTDNDILEPHQYTRAGKYLLLSCNREIPYTISW